LSSLEHEKTTINKIEMNVSVIRIAIKAYLFIDTKGNHKTLQGDGKKVSG